MNAITVRRALTLTTMLLIAASLVAVAVWVPVQAQQSEPEPERCPFVVRMTVGTTQSTAPIFLSLRDKQGVVAQDIAITAHGSDLHGLGPSDRPAYGQIWITHTEGTHTGNSVETYRLDGELTTATVTGVDIVGRVEWLLVTQGLYQPDVPVEPTLRPEPQNPSERIPQMPAWKTGGHDWRSHFETGWGYPVPHRTPGHDEDLITEAAHWRVALSTHYFDMPNSPWNTGNSKPIPSNESHDKSTWPPGMENLVKRIDAFWAYADQYSADKEAWDAEKLQYDADYVTYQADVAEYQRLVALLVTSKLYYEQFGIDNEAHRIHSGYAANGFRHPPDGANKTGWWRDASLGPATVTVNFDHPRCADAVIPIDKALALEANPVTLVAFDHEGYRPVYIPPPPTEAVVETEAGSIEEKLDKLLERIESMEKQLARIEAKLDSQ